MGKCGATERERACDKAPLSATIVTYVRGSCASLGLVAGTVACAHLCRVVHDAVSAVVVPIFEVTE